MAPDASIGPTSPPRDRVGERTAGLTAAPLPGHLAAAMELILALACDDARVRPDGKLDVIGVFNELSAPGFPASQERMTVVFVVEWASEDAGRRPLRADLLDQAGAHVLTIEGHTEVDDREAGRAPAQTRLIMPLENVIFPHAGRYHFELRSGEEVRPAFSLFVGAQPDEAGPDLGS